MRVFITDTTLREGVQSKELELSYEEKRCLFYLIASAGVEEIEVGIPAHSEEERAFIKELVKGRFGDRVIAWNRANPKDLELSIHCGVKRVEIAFPISDIMLREKLKKDRHYILELAKDLIPYCKSIGLYTSVGLEDASRAEEVFVYDFVLHVKSLGADRVRLSDTVGVLNPIQTQRLVKNISSMIDVEVHLHNDFGMATANAVVASLGGARFINTSLLGLGERCGITPTEEVVFYLDIIQGIETGVDLKKIYQAIEYLIETKGLRVHPNKPIVGRNAFVNKSSIHINGLLKSKRTYLPFNPEIIGRKMSFAFGKYSKKS